MSNYQYYYTILNDEYRDHSVCNLDDFGWKDEQNDVEGHEPEQYDGNANMLSAIIASSLYVFMINYLNRDPTSDIFLGMLGTFKDPSVAQ
jgi:hypothetical protein